MAKEKGKRKYSVQLAFVGLFTAFIALSIGLLNSYPTISSRDIVFANKQETMLSQVSVMSSSLSGLEKLSIEGVTQVMELVDVYEFDRVIVTDGGAGILYDSSAEDRVGASALFAEVIDALEGEAVFASSYDGEAFVSRAAAPVVSYGEVIGCVYLCQRDSQQAELIGEIQGRLRGISIVAGAIALLLIVVFTKALTRRITDLVRAMRIVREGDYEYRIEPKGSDEVTELAEEFNDMSQRLQDTEELRRRFVSDASHELRTPLASIRLLSDSIVQSENMDEETMREFVTDIGSEAERLQRLTEKLMMLTKMDSHVEQSAVPVDMQKVAESTVHLLEPLAKAKEVSISTALSEGCVIKASEDSIYQIVFNLAENAIKYNVPGGTVYICLDKADGDARLRVEDTGIGIPDGDMEHIFARFYRVDKARSREAGGSGLGLSIVHDTVEHFGGSISVAHREGGGSVFTVLFPLLEKEGEDG